MLSANLNRFHSLDGLRTFACVGIVLMHVLSNTHVKPDSCYLVDNVIHLSSDFVMLFMMVSSFSLCCGYYDRFKDGAIKLKDFYYKRYIRILPFFTLLTLLDLAKTIVEEHFVFSNAVKYSVVECFNNITLLFGYIPDHDITVIGVGWFLGIIFLFYIFFPFFIFMMDSKKSAWMWLLVIIGIYFSGKYYFNPVKGISFGNRTFIHSLPFFLMGGIIYLYRSLFVGLSVYVQWLLRVVTIIYTLYYFTMTEYRFVLSNLVLYSLWLLYAVAEINTERHITILNNKVVKFVSGISMEVYLCHMMFFRVVEKIHLEKHVSNNNFNYIFTAVLVLLLAVTFSYGWKKYVEPKVINKLQNK